MMVLLLAAEKEGQSKSAKLELQIWGRFREPPWASLTLSWFLGLSPIECWEGGEPSVQLWYPVLST